jgi:3-hydroxyisobutyrate dehydrogenase-like beta-hydroxyacid dehydrogenase
VSVSVGKPRIGFIGLGAMGRGMARNLAAKGFPLTVVGNRNRAPVDDLKSRGATEAKTPAEAAARSDIVIVCVTETPVVEQIVYGPEGVLKAAHKDLILIDCTTSEPVSTDRIIADCKLEGVRFADAPLARSPKEAEEGRLNAMVGADADTFAIIEPVLKAFCENIFHVGGPGAGHKTKLVYNFLTMGQAALISEALVAAAKSGLDLDAFCKVVTAGGANSGIFQMIAPSALAGTYDGLNFGLDLARKDLRYYTHLTEHLGLPSHLGETVHQSFVLASALGYGDRLVGSMVAAQEKITGTAIARR